MMGVDYIETWKKVIQSPSDFYREMPITGGYFYPIIFASVSAIICSLIHLIFIPETDEVREFIFAIPMFAAIIILVVSIAALFVDATILHIIYELLGGTRTYEGTAI